MDCARRLGELTIVEHIVGAVLREQGELSHGWVPARAAVVHVREAGDIAPVCGEPAGVLAIYICDGFCEAVWEACSCEDVPAAC